MNESRLCIGAVLAALAAALVACENPFRAVDADYGPALPPERTREIDALDLDSMRASDERAPSLEAPPDPFSEMDELHLTLEQARAWTLENNLDLRVALIEPTIANQSVSEEEAAWESVFFSNLRVTSLQQPTASQLVGSEIDQVDFDLGVRVPLRTGGQATVRLPFNRTETNNQFSILNPSFSSDVELSISQPLLRGAGRRSATHALRVAALSEGVQESRTKLEVIRQLAAADRAYWRLYAARRALEVTQRQYELAMAQLERARRLVRAGQAAEIEVIRAEEGLAQRLEAIIVAQNDVLLRQRELKRLMNVPGLKLDSPVALIPDSDPDPARYELEDSALMDAALANRMELLELELQLAIDESSIAFERNRALPLFSLDYTYRINGLGATINESVNTLRSGDFDDWTLALSAEIPIGNQAAKARVQRAVLERLQRLSSQDARELAITQEVLDAIDSMDSGWQRILAAAQSSILASRTLEAEQRHFEVGRSTSTDVLDAATRLADAQLAEIRAVTEYEIAKIDLAFATGTLFGAARVNWSPLDPRPEQVSSAMRAQDSR